MIQPFNPYAGAAESPDDNGIRMPEPLMSATSHAGTIYRLLGRLRDATEVERARYPWADRFVMGYPLPDWQRGLVWSHEQKVRLIESVWTGIGIGSFILNDDFEMDEAGYFRKFSDVVLDGQQRLNAIQGYVTNEFSVPDTNGDLRFWEELPLRERRRFANMHFPHLAVKSWDETFLRKVYDRHAFGATPHNPNDRALQNCTGR